MSFTFIMGVASGLPLLLTLGTLQAWMHDAKVSIEHIGLMNIVTTPYSFKFVLAPFLDRFAMPFMSRRKGWLFVIQLLCALSIAGIGFFDPVNTPLLFVLAAFQIALFSSTQDTIVDAYRREILTDEELGLGSSLYVTGYRIGMVLGGAVALKLADAYSVEFGTMGVWKLVYAVMGGIMAILALLTLFAPTEKVELKPKTIKEAVIEPFKEFFSRKGAWVILAFIILYKFGDALASALTTKYILEMGYSKNQLADIGKIFGLGATIAGGLIGGVAILKLKINKALWIFGFLQAVSTLGFILLNMYHPSTILLAGVVAFENLASGMGTSAYAAYMAALTNKKFTATQYALLTSLMSVPRTLVAGTTGYLQIYLDWNGFFIFCTVIAVPGMLLLFRIAPFKGNRIQEDL